MAKSPKSTVPYQGRVEVIFACRKGIITVRQIERENPRRGSGWTGGKVQWHEWSK